MGRTILGRLWRRLVRGDRTGDKSTRTVGCGCCAPETSAADTEATSDDGCC